MATVENTQLVERFDQFYRNYYRDAIGSLAQGYPTEQRSLAVDWTDLYRFDQDLADDYLAQPDQLRDYAEEALRLYDLPIDVSLGQAHVRVFNLDGTTDIRAIRARDVNTLVSVSGIVRKATDVRPKVEEAAFECQRCGTLTYIPQSGAFQEPHECQGCERQGPFVINYDQSTFVDSQKLRVQERPEGLRGGETPQSIDCHLEDDLPGRVAPGDHVTVTGVLRIEQVTNRNQKSRVFDVYMEGHSLVIDDEEFEDMDITEEDKRAIIELSQQDEALYEMMVDSIAPSIYGFEDEKLAMSLQLFAGVTKALPDGTRIRGDLHILLIGDPGTGKSQLLQYIRNIAPRSVYTSGKGSSAAGLTAAAVQDDFGDGQQWTLEAGALVLADKGIAAVDEIDKMRPEDRSAMHEALEQQSISVSKAGINATLKSRCALLGAANPKYGRFDQYEPIAEQIDLEPALISRFDLIFTVTDHPDASRDGELADHILRTNYAGELNTQLRELAAPTITEDDVRAAADEVIPAIEPDLFRKYIAYAKRNVFPSISDEARGAIRDFYVDLRAQGLEADAPVPITARKLEALVRLAEASARVRLSDVVELEDAERVIAVVRGSLKDIGVDPETGQFDADVIETGRSKTQRDRIKSIRALIREIETEYEDGAPMEEVVRRAGEAGIDESKVEHEIEKLRQRGEVYEPATGHLRTT